jgi:hypothetical protein
MEVISPDQSAFLPMRYILSNIVLTQETLNWAKTSKQLLLMMKLDFTKAYNQVSWRFLFYVMEALGFDNVFINMIKLLFTSSVYFNGSPSRTFNIIRGVRQGCPLVLYLFLLVGEILNIQVHMALQERQIKGIK